ncbi:hypothetical protein BFJ70_g14519 [Fusarium oxysporum]|nr:hypothetical protein BFJ70_g14519 [Fusarium oxysporum]
MVAMLSMQRRQFITSIRPGYRVRYGSYEASQDEAGDLHRMTQPAAYYQA